MLPLDGREKRKIGKSATVYIDDGWGSYVWGEELNDSLLIKDAVHSQTVPVVSTNAKKELRGG